ncbi:helix-turn-helix domain-containing protein [Achromobacter pestifer]|uniref:HTH-type transcriptional activator RhaR n=1 Tax=Achromobacter pestifer TaxID=1353889 RepID=A0A6S6ZKH2_9BURK|nr:AraC family transcriptional regulator [Achromobacter pestifer]CAB3628765.1 HTH-type transcriptional activator RhaR [Achromobacter pestifer]
MAQCPDTRPSLGHVYPGASIQAIRTSAGCKAGLEILRVGYALPDFGVARSQDESEDFLVRVSLDPRPRAQHDGGSSDPLSLAPDALTIRRASDPYRLELRTPFDLLYFRVPPESLEQLSEDLGGPRIQGLSCPPGHSDPVLARLGHALLPALENPSLADPLFVDHIALAVQVHVAQAYGGAAPDTPQARSGLAAWQEKLAKEMLTADLLANVSISDVAQGCGLSRSYFIKAFRQTAGTTPHRWLLEHRVDKAKILLLKSDQSVADIARDCGFSDQAHLTRLFASTIGVPPAAWRRQNRN